MGALAGKAEVDKFRAKKPVVAGKSVLKGAKSQTRTRLGTNFLKSSGWGRIREETVLLSGVERHALIMKGLRTSILKATLNSFRRVPESMLLDAIGISSKTLDRREEALLGSRHSDAAMALIEITTLAERVLGTLDLAERWLEAPAIALDGKRPLDLLTSAPGIEAVKDLLIRMEYGVYA